ncbi:MAG: hypothetical protein Q8O03_00835 [Nanoarchaeota archaeon]|nr:hypothetical protein [Nanoarchaeota archaeon]
MKLFSLITIIFLLITLNGCDTSITGKAVITPTEDSEPKQIIVPANQYSSDMDLFDASKIHDEDLSEDAWSTNEFVTPKYVKIDAGIGKSYAFSIINCHFYNGWYDIQYSDDNTKWVTATTLWSSGNSPWTDAHWGFVGYHRYWRLSFTSRYWDEKTTGQEIQWWGYTK